jgi:uncharacterized iron-regulated protein
VILAVAAPRASAGEGWVSTRHRDHPLVGAVWSVGEDRFLSTPEFHARLASADVAILGEIHDNADHHRLQAEMLRAIAGRGQAPSVVFEMIPRDLAPQLEAYLRDRPGDAAGLGPAVTWSERGWPDWAIYRPIAQAALANGLPILAGGLDAATQRTVGREGPAALPPAERERLALDAELPDRTAELLGATLAQVHCGLMPADALGPMRFVQRARDGALADAVARALERGPVVLIAGAGHARRDWGVPFSLAARSPGADVISLAFVEVDPDATEPAAYAPESADGEPVHDILVFTPAAEREDPCAAFERRMEERGEGGSGG